MNSKTKNKLPHYDYVEHSGTIPEATGLIPSLPKSEAEKESYQELGHYCPEPVDEKTSSFLRTR